ncbi:DUF5606 domain-containing protein [Fibrella sp. HMF5335]|uniref:DUF5606 domain-containing protein n=1 Tax=Fibrella rubiginis TaxID=2817060 RepID=A0A939K442_9BACT|nr:DUF5606 domain-containing protein [Fibrella rubiginis]MBO0936293.1 DUF5606 domain-containing protein [Fibrella rubiginis]
MEALKTIANVSGYPGLYRILKPGRSGVIVETIDAKKTKTMMGPQARVSVLNDISMYVDRPDAASSDQSVPLGEVFMAVANTFGDTLPVTSKADGSELADFMSQVLPDYDRERVRDTDIRKLISWYGILRAFAPEVFTVAEPATEETPEATSTDEAPVAATSTEEKAAE